MSNARAALRRALSYAIDPSSEFANKTISTAVVCTTDGACMPVQAGENRSGTWIFTRTAAGWSRGMTTATLAAHPMQ